MTDLVDTYWRCVRRMSGDRAQRLAADTDFWAWEAVEEAMATGGAEALDLLGALLDADEADPFYVGAGPLEELVLAHGVALEAALAERCRRVTGWREAMTAVDLDDAARTTVPLLRPYLAHR